MTIGEKIFGAALLLCVPGVIYFAGAAAKAERAKLDAKQQAVEAIRRATEVEQSCYYPPGWMRERENMIFDCTQRLCAVNGWECRSYLCSEAEDAWFSERYIGP